MQIQRAKYLKEFCHESVIRLDQGIIDGKKIANIDTVKRVFEILEEVLRHIEVYDAVKD